MNGSLTPGGEEFCFLRSLFIDSKKEFETIPVNQKQKKQNINARNWKNIGQNFACHLFPIALIFKALSVNVTAEDNLSLNDSNVLFLSQHIHKSVIAGNISTESDQSFYGLIWKSEIISIQRKTIYDTVNLGTKNKSKNIFKLILSSFIYKCIRLYNTISLKSYIIEHIIIGTQKLFIFYIY